MNLIPTSTSVILTLLGSGMLLLTVVFLWHNGLTGVFRVVSDTINGGENAIIDAISAVTPYLVPIIPAYMTFFHVHDPRAMDFPVEIAWTAAIVVEFLGMGSIATTIRLFRNQQIQRAEKNKFQAGFWLALATYVFYLVITMTVNVMLERDLGDRSVTVIWAIALFSLLSVPSGVLIAVRAIYRDILEEKDAPRLRPQSLQDLTTKEILKQSGYERKPKHASDYQSEISQAIASLHAAGSFPTPKMVTETLAKNKIVLDHERSKGYIHGKISQWARENNIEKPKNPLTF